MNLVVGFCLHILQPNCGMIRIKLTVLDFKNTIVI